MAQVKNGINIATNGGALLPMGIPGAGYDFNPRDVISKRNNTTGTGSAARIVFGTFVAREGAKTVKKIAADADVAIGFAMYSAEKLFNADGTETGWDKDDTVPVAKRGFYYAKAAEAVNENDDVISITASNGIGSVQTGAAAAGRVAIANAKWRTTTASGEVGVISIDFQI
jgi:hypothetical protein